MNIISQRIKYWLSRDRPLILDKAICCLTPDSRLEVKLDEKIKLNEQNYLLRFELPDSEKVLGCNMGEHVKIILNDQYYRYYSPISSFDQLGYADFLIKLVDTNKQESMSKMFKDIQPGDKIQIEGPYQNICYLGNGRFIIDKQDRKCRHLGLIVENTAISSVFQIVESIATSKDDTFLSLVYVVDSLEQAALIEELSFFKQLNKVHINVVVQEPNTKGLLGPLSQQIMEDYLPDVSDETLIIACGSSGFKTVVQSYLDGKEYSQEMYHII